MTNTKDTNRAEFEAWATHPDRAGKLPIEKHLNGAYRDTRTYTAWYGWKSARAIAAEPQIDGYPLWSGLPPPVERGMLSDAEIATMGYVKFGIVADDAEIVAFARAILDAHGLSAQADHMEDKRDMVTQSTDMENVSKTQHEINMEGLMSQRMILCETCGNKRCPHANDPDNYACTGSNEPGQDGSAYPTLQWKLAPHPPSRRCMCEECKPSFETDCLGNEPPITQPLIAEAAPSTSPASDEVQAFAIDVEKCLCAALDREWSATGMSIESLIVDLKNRGASSADQVERSRSIAASEAARDNTAKMDTDESREYLREFMYANFSDTTFSRYIREQLAGDFAYQMANAIAAVKRDDVAGDAARLSAIFSALPLDYFCAAFDVPPPPENDMLDFSAWAKSVIDAHIAAGTKKVD